MGLHAEDLAAVAADALEHAVAIEQTVIVDADLGVFLSVKLAVNVDLEGHLFIPRGYVGEVQSSIGTIKWAWLEMSGIRPSCV